MWLLYIAHVKINANRYNMSINFEPKQPAQFKGMKVLELRYVKLDDIVTLRGQNTAREMGADPQKVAQFSRLIRNGGYEPFYHEPPTVFVNESGEYELANGDHRFQGHLNAKKEEMWVALVEFDSEKTLEEYRLFANQGADDQTTYVKNDRSDGDIIKGVISIMQKHDIEPTIENVKKQLKRIEATNRNSYNKIVTEILKNFKVKVETIQTYGEVTGMRRYSQISESNNVACFSTSRIDSRDQQYRQVFKVLKAKRDAKDPSLPVDVVMSVNKQSTRSGVNKVRKTITKDLSDLFDIFTEFAPILLSENFTRPQVTWLPQTEYEVKNKKMVVYDV
jgi:hypothetical protein